MKYTFLFCMFITCFYEHKSKTNLNTERKSSQVESLGKSIEEQQNKSYHFNDSSVIIGCGNIFLQKKSADNRYELLITIEGDSVSSGAHSLKELRHLIKVVLREYPEGNLFIRERCDDSGGEEYDKEPNVYEGVSGTVVVQTSIRGDRGMFRASVSLINISLVNKTNKLMTLPTERFDNVRVGWYAG